MFCPVQTCLVFFFPMWFIHKKRFWKPWSSRRSGKSFRQFKSWFCSCKLGDCSAGTWEYLPGRGTCIWTKPSIFRFYMKIFRGVSRGVSKFSCFEALFSWTDGLVFLKEGLGFLEQVSFPNSWWSSRWWKLKCSIFSNFHPYLPGENINSNWTWAYLSNGLGKKNQPPIRTALRLLELVLGVLEGFGASGV